VNWLLNIFLFNIYIVKLNKIILKDFSFRNILTIVLVQLLLDYKVFNKESISNISFVKSSNNFTISYTIP